MARRLAVKVFGYPTQFDAQELLNVATRNCSLQQVMAKNNNPPYDIIFTCTTEHDANLLTNYLCNIRYIGAKSVNLQAEQIAFNPHPDHLTAQQRQQNVAPLRPTNANVQHNSQAGPSSRIPNGTPRQKSESLQKIRKSVRSILACNKNGADPLSFINDYKALCSENFFDSIKREGYRDMTEFCNDNLDAIDYEVFQNGGAVILHGVADAKSKHIFDMNKHTRNKKRPNLKALPSRMKHFFGNFIKPNRVAVEQFNQANKPPGLPEVNKRRIIAIIKEHPSGITERDFQSEYLEKFEEPINLSDMRRFTGLWTLQDILSTVDDITLQPVANANSRWMMCTAAEPEPEKETAMPKDITTTPQFVKLVSDISAFIKRSPEYTIMMADLQKSHLKIDCSLYGKATLQELISLVPEVHMRRKGGEWIIRLPQEEQGDDLPYTVKHNIYSMLNSDGNGFLLAEFDQAYQTHTGSRLNPRDYSYKSLWHLLQANTELCMMESIDEGLLLLAGTKPTPPPNQLQPASSRRSLPQQAAPPVRPAVSEQRNFSTPPMFANIEPPAIGDYEKDLGYYTFKEDGGHLLIYISVIYSPNEFYCLPSADERLKKEHTDQRAEMQRYYSIAGNRMKNQKPPVLGLNMLCAVSDEHDQWHRVIVDRTSYTDVIRVRSIDSGKRFDAPVNSVYKLAEQFKHPCYARRCSLYGIKPFNADSWSPEAESIFGPAQSDKFFYSKLDAIENEVMMFTIIDTHGKEDRNYSEVLEAMGLAEFVHSIAQPNNAPPVEDLDDSWLDDWIDGSDEEVPQPAAPLAAPLAAPYVASPPVPYVAPPPGISYAPQQPLTSTILQRMTYHQICDLKLQRVEQRVELAQLLRADVSQTHLYSAVDGDIQLIDRFLNVARAQEAARDAARAAEPTNLWETHPAVSPAPSILNVTSPVSNQLQQIGQSMEEVALSQPAYNNQSFAAPPSADSNNFLLNLMKHGGVNQTMPSPTTNTSNIIEPVNTSAPDFGGGRVVRGRGMGAPPPSTYTSLGRGTSR